VVIGRQHWLPVDISCDKVLPLWEFVGRGEEIAPRGCCGLQGGKWGWSTIEGSAFGSLQALYRSRVSESPRADRELLGLEMVQRLTTGNMRSCDVLLKTNSLPPCL